MNARAIGIAALVAALFAAGWFTRKWYDDSQELVIQKAAQAAQLAAAQEIKNIEIKNTVINQKIVERTFHEPVYQDCKHTPEEFNYIKELFKK